MKRLSTAFSYPKTKIHSFPFSSVNKQNCNTNLVPLQYYVNYHETRHYASTSDPLSIQSLPRSLLQSTTKWETLGVSRLHLRATTFRRDHHLVNNNYSTNNNRANNYSCWKCGQQLGGGGVGGEENQNQTKKFSLQCPNCKTLQRLDVHYKMGETTISPNYFEIFGEKVTYRIDLSKLAVEMKILQKNLHPDLFSLKSKEEQELSEQLSSFVNKAYSTLINPMDRAMYILQLQGIDSQTMEKKMTADVQFLSQVMELNERLEEISDAQQLATFRQENNDQLKSLRSELERSFDANNIDEAVLVVSKMKYFDNLQQKLKEVQSRLGVVD